MKEIIKSNGKLMSSKRIAERTGKQHSHVIRDIRNMVSELEKDNPKMDSADYQVVIHPTTNLTSEILLNERLSLCLASGYSIPLRMAIIDDWGKMKAENTIPATYAQALLEAGRLALEIENKNILIEEMKPKADFYDVVTDSKDAVDLGIASKVLKLGYGRTTLFKNLRDEGVLMKNNIPYQEKVDAGWFTVVETSWSKPNGDSHIYYKTFVLQKGLDGIRKLLTK
jgi:phage antirepressor YoqD-like protein